MSLTMNLMKGATNLPLVVVFTLVSNFLLCLFGLLFSFYVSRFPTDFLIFGKFSFATGIASWATLFQLSFTSAVGCDTCAWGWRKLSSLSQLNNNGNENNLQDGYCLKENLEAKDVNYFLNANSLDLWLVPKFWCTHIRALFFLFCVTMSLTINPWAAQCLGKKQVADPSEAHVSYRRIEDESIAPWFALDYGEIDGFSVDGLRNFNAGPWSSETYVELNCSKKNCHLSHADLGYNIALNCTEAPVNQTFYAGDYWYDGSLDLDKSRYYLNWNYTHNTNGINRSRNCIFYAFNETRDITDQSIAPIIVRSTTALPNNPSWEIGLAEKGTRQGYYVIVGLSYALGLSYPFTGIQIFDLAKGCLGYNRDGGVPQKGNILLLLLGGRDTLTTPEILEDKVREYVARFIFNLRSNGTLQNETCSDCSYHEVYSVDIKLFYPMILLFLVLSVYFLVGCAYSVGVEGVWRGKDYMAVSLKMRHWISKVKDEDAERIGETELEKRYGHLPL